uniref:Fe2OG dioxygenase domain-containing protein n=1 Tax=Meloidogyne enterolobii TaxID=390850 RepID=A0A6V7V2Y6_MELEN|nr:unnamed protein product [Meloidogyne enterolobii]
MEEANERYYLLEKEFREINKSDILNILSISLYKQGNLKRALIINDKLIELDPLYPNATNNSKLYEQELLANGVVEEDLRSNIPPLNNYRSLNDSYIGSVDYQVYEELCRGEKEINITEISKLYCYYKMDRSFLRLAPIKVEIIRFEPLAVIFRNVVADEEIEILKRLSMPKMTISKVQHLKTGEPIIAPYRISKIAWLYPWENEVVLQLFKRMIFMTNLNMGSAEPLQIGNYGIGGHFRPHFDFARDNSTNTKESQKGYHFLNLGTRIATALFYLSTPEKGDIQFLVMLKHLLNQLKMMPFFGIICGEVEMGILEHACPVLLGDKWVSNSWIHEGGQEFFRPCGLDPSIQERYVGDLGGLEPKKYPNISPYCKEGVDCE